MACSTQSNNIVSCECNHIRGHTPTETERTTAGRAEAPLRTSTAFEVRGGTAFRQPAATPPAAALSLRNARPSAPAGSACDRRDVKLPARTPTTGRASAAEEPALALHDPARSTLDPAFVRDCDGARPPIAPRRRADSDPEPPEPRPLRSLVLVARMSPELMPLSAGRSPASPPEAQRCARCPPPAGVVVGDGCALAYASTGPTRPTSALLTLLGQLALPLLRAPGWPHAMQCLLRICRAHDPSYRSADASSHCLPFSRSAESLPVAVHQHQALSEQ